LSYDVWRYQEEADGNDHTSNVWLSSAWARGKALMETCAQDNEISKHMNTVPVVRDMVEITERHGEWRSKQAELWLASKEGKSSTVGKEAGDLYSRQAVIERTKWQKGDEKLQYWGFSYGTLLGQTFAAMFPNRVSRMVLDGVGDSSDYYNTAWMLGLNDTDKIMAKFFEYCSATGPEKCALNIDNATSSDIQKSVDSLISSLHENPIAVPGNGTRGSEIITYSDVMLMIRYLIYRPLDKFPEMAHLLADVVHGNGSAFAEYKQKAHKRTCLFSKTKGGKHDRQSCQPRSDGGAVTRAILCSDGRDITNNTKEDFKQTGRALYRQSRWLGEFWTTVTLPCVHWKVRPKWSITAGKKLASETPNQINVRSDDIKGETSHPILWIGNTLDPVTPLAK
jgi:pimeloyl-ACP methyl ester carboxylesterase